MLIPENAPSPYDHLLLLAERDPPAAVRLALHEWQHAPSSDPLMQAWATYTLGWAMLRWNQVGAAQQYLEAACAAYQDLNLPILVLACRRALLIARLLLEAHADLQTQWSKLVADYQAAHLSLEACRTQIHQIAHINIIGMPQVALSMASQIEQQIQAEGTADDQARLLRVKAIAAKHAGRFNEAVDQLNQAQTLFMELGFEVEVAKCLLEQAHISELRGIFEQAQRQIDHALQIFQRFELVLHVAACEKNLGLVSSRLGQLGQALTYTLRARTTFLEAGQLEQTAQCDLNLGNIGYYSGLFDMAFIAYQRAEAVYAQLGMQRDLLIIKRNQALVLHEQGHFQAAFDVLSALEHDVETTGGVLELSEVYQAKAQALRSLGDYRGALRQLDLAEAQLASQGEQVSHADVLLSRGWIYLSLGDLQSAEYCLRAAYAGHHKQHIHTWRIFHGLARCATARGEIGEALIYYQRASLIVSRLRNALANEQASSGLFVQARQLYDDAIRLAAATNNTLLVLNLSDQQRALVLQQRLDMHQLHIPGELVARYEQQRQRLRHLMWNAASLEELDAALVEYTDLLLQISYSKPLPQLTPAETPTIEEVRDELNQVFPRGWLVLNYVDCRDELLLVVLSREQLNLVRIPIDRALERLFDEACLAHSREATYRDWARRRDPSRPPWDNLRRLAEHLLPPFVQEQLYPDLRLLIVPGGRLHHLAWACLRVANDWLCERAIIQTLPSLLRWAPCPSQPDGGEAALILGCSQFGSRALALPAIDAELDMVADHWPGSTTCLLNEAVTREALLELVARQQFAHYRLIHIASHAQLVAEHGLLAHIMLWDEDFLYDEVSRLRLNSALIVLSACHGAIGEVLPGEEVLSLSRAFLRAGAQDVIANLWPSYDDAALTLMRLLYEHIMAGLDAPHAVAQMQRTLLTYPEDLMDGAIDYRSPLVWGGIHVVGSGTARLATAEGTFPAVH